MCMLNNSRVSAAENEVPVTLAASKRRLGNTLLFSEGAVECDNNNDD